jgi:hypothetical protein
MCTICLAVGGWFLAFLACIGMSNGVMEFLMLAFSVTGRVVEVVLKIPSSTGIEELRDYIIDEERCSYVFCDAVRQCSLACGHC